MSESIVGIYDDNVATWLAFKEGSWDAYTQLYNNHFKVLNNYGYKFTRDVNIIEDAIHDLFIKLWTNRATLGTPASVKNYLYKSLRGIIFRKMQGQSRFVDLESETDYNFSFEISFDHQIIANEEERELQHKIKTVVKTLPARQQEIIYLRFYEGLGYEEISDIMEININSTYKLLYKAFNNLQGALKTSKLVIVIGLYGCLGTHIHAN
ncbi:RNA polymerase sigma factor [Mucilaginibacter ginsenosidivorax]|uniref:Sigma-70 family RNA polymerase sigma factor n=1 Tax=Mucilaginibacter ginsenosidivorax TaxID=862126 RepID=A0A5B8VUC5_9SPHI|nr:sigma-70 family RNA polymerase sigma factor [Mucilaginibacter ginsenosidivorax]QEC74853.1 sigma-70 family RNA polymerase sigma factor [Mucilaginibacter ginsenosidivorax]